MDEIDAPPTHGDLLLEVIALRKENRRLREGIREFILWCEGYGDRTADFDWHAHFRGVLKRAKVTP